MKKWVLSILGCALLLVRVSAQAPISGEAEQTQLTHMEATAEITSDDINEFEDAEWAVALREEKIDLNASDAVNKLGEFPFIHQKDLLQFMLYRVTCGPFLDPLELQAVPGWTVAAVRTLLPYLCVKRIPESVSSRKRFWQTSRIQADVLIDVSTYSNELPISFRDIVSIRKRYLFKSPFGVKAGLVLEKDRGEPLLTDRSGLPDHVGYFFERKSSSFLETLIAGDFRVQLGIGLLKNQNKGGQRALFRQFTASNTPFVQPHQSFQEWQHERGFAFQCQQGKWKAGMYFSTKKMDARLSTDSTPIVLAWNRTGLHRDSSEIDRKDRVAISEWGGQVQYQQNNVTLAVHGLYSRWSHPFQLVDNVFLEKPLRWVGVQAGFGFTTSFSIRNLFLTTEYAYRPQVGSALAAGLLLSMGKTTDLAIDVSVAGKKFCFFNNQVHEPVALADQRRFLKTVFRYMPSTRMEFNIHSSWMENPLSLGLSVRQEVGLQARFKFMGSHPVLDISCFGSFRQNGSNIVLYPITDESRQYKLNIKLTAPPKLRNEWTLGVVSQYQQASIPLRSSGMAFYGNVNAYVAGIRIKVGAILFQTDNFQSRIYFPFLGLNNSKTVEYVYGKGYLLYAGYDWKPQKWLSISMQFRVRRIADTGSSKQLLRGLVAIRLLREAVE